MAATKHIRARKTLESLREQVARELRQRSGIEVEHNADPMDQILSLIDRESRLNYLENLAARYRAVTQALARINRGEYGICQECDEPIPARRLEAIPWAECCVACQERREREMGGEWDLDAAA